MYTNLQTKFVLNFEKKKFKHKHHPHKIKMPQKSSFWFLQQNLFKKNRKTKFWNSNLFAIFFPINFFSLSGKHLFCAENVSRFVLFILSLRNRLTLCTYAIYVDTMCVPHYQIFSRTKLRPAVTQIDWIIWHPLNSELNNYAKKNGIEVCTIMMSTRNCIEVSFIMSTHWTFGQLFHLFAASCTTFVTVFVTNFCYWNVSLS